MVGEPPGRAKLRPLASDVAPRQGVRRGAYDPSSAERLHISTKTADHRIQHIYVKIGVSTRAAAALWAIQHAVVS